MENIKQAKIIRIVTLSLLVFSILLRIITIPSNINKVFSILSCAVLLIYIAFLINKTNEKIMMSILVALNIIKVIYSIHTNIVLAKYSDFLNVTDTIVLSLISNCIVFAFWIVFSIYVFTQKPILLKISMIVAIINLMYLTIWLLIDIFRPSFYNLVDFDRVMGLIAIASFYGALLLFEFNKPKIKLLK
jgi:hypothetical protein